MQLDEPEAGGGPAAGAGTRRDRFFDRWTDGSEHQVLERLWYLCLRQGMDPASLRGGDGSVTLSAILKRFPDGGRGRGSGGPRMLALLACLAAVFSAAAAVDTLASDHRLYYDNVTGRKGDRQALDAAKEAKTHAAEQRAAKRQARALGAG
jgi:hypothetical protein